MIDKIVAEERARLKESQKDQIKASRIEYWRNYRLKRREVILQNREVDRRAAVWRKEIMKKREQLKKECQSQVHRHLTDSILERVVQERTLLGWQPAIRKWHWFFCIMGMESRFLLILGPFKRPLPPKPKIASPPPYLKPTSPQRTIKSPKPRHPALGESFIPARPQPKGQTMKRPMLQHQPIQERPQKLITIPASMGKRPLTQTPGSTSALPQKRQRVETEAMRLSIEQQSKKMKSAKKTVAEKRLSATPTGKLPKLKIRRLERPADQPKQQPSTSAFHDEASKVEQQMEQPKPKEEELHCICRTPLDRTKFYVQCDLCGRWFHGKCVGITQKMSKQMSTWSCGDCQRAKETATKELYCVCQTPYDESK